MGLCHVTLHPRLAAASKPLVLTQQDDRASANAVNRRAGGWREYLDCAVRFVESHAVGAEMTFKDNLVDRRAKTNSGAIEVLVDRIRQRDGNGIFGPDGVGKVAATRRQAHRRYRYRGRVRSWCYYVYNGVVVGSSP